MTVRERRAALLEWFYADEERAGMTAHEIRYEAMWRPLTGTSWRYVYNVREVGDDPQGRCLEDLKALARDGQVKRGEGRPARWWYT